MAEFVHQLAQPTFRQATSVTLTRGVVGFRLAAVSGLALGVLVPKSQILLTALGSLITGLQTMPSIAWFPLAILLVQLSEQAILFVILIGAVPSVTNGVIAGVDYVRPLLVRAGRNLVAHGFALHRHVVLPAALLGIVSRLKQSCAFAWRSLLAGQLIVAIANRPSLCAHLSDSRELGEPAYMIAILLIGRSPTPPSPAWTTSSATAEEDATGRGLPRSSSRPSSPTCAEAGWWPAPAAPPAATRSPSRPRRSRSATSCGWRRPAR